MTRIAIDSTDYRGRTSRPGASTVTIIPFCSRCGSALGGRLEKVERTLRGEVRIWLCGCGRRRRIRRAAAG